MANIPNFKCAIPSTAINNALVGGQSAYTLLGPDGIPQTALANLGAGVRPRLGINMDFRFNQRGQPAYTAFGHGLDGWRVEYSGGLTSGSVDFNDPGVTITANGPSTAYLDIQQYFEDDLLGKTVTFSVLYDDGTFLTITGQVPASAPSSGAVTVFSAENTKSGIWIRLTSGGKVFVQIRAKAGYSVSPVSAKLEEGPNQTLAYQDSTGAWHRLPQPEDGDYAGQLLRCQRYLVPLPLTGADDYAPIGFGYSYSTNSVRIFIPTPVQMRDDPVIQYISGDLSGFSILCNGTSYTPTAVANISALSGGVAIAFTVSGITAGYTCVLRTQRAYAMLSAQL